MDIDEVLTRGVEQIIPSKEDLKYLIQKRKITLYQGFDPTTPNLHIGHLAGIMKLRQFQKMGHKIIFLIGDFTARIGDPTGKLSARKMLSENEVKRNLKGWKKIVQKIIDFNGKNKAEIVFNSRWNEKITFADLIKICSNFTVQQMIERNMFQERMKRKNPIFLSEFLYPVAQAIDCVNLNVDLEIGGSDQLFNMLAGRQLMLATTKKEKFVMTLKLLTDKEGKKIGKTEGNAIVFNKGEIDTYGKIMSLPDEIIYPAFELLTEVSLSKKMKEIKENPMREKKKLAFEITKIIYGERKAIQAEIHFEKTFQKKKPDFNQKTKNMGTLAKTIAVHTPRKSISEAKRLIINKAVEVNGKLIQDPTYKTRKGDKIKVGEKIFLQVE